MSSRFVYVLGFVVAAACGGPARVAAQSGVSTPWSLFSVRVDSRTSDFIYAVYGYGDHFGMVGVLQNPRSGYNELLAAVGEKFAIAGGPTQFAAVGAARASDAWYAQIYFLPTLHRDRAWLRATT